MKRHIAAQTILLSCLLLSGPVTAAPAMDVFQVVNVGKNDSLNMRAWPSAKSKVVATLPYNAKWIASRRAPVTKEGASWREVYWNGTKGWINAKYIQFDPASTAKARERQNHRLNRNTAADQKQKKTSVASRSAPATPAGKQVTMKCGGNSPFWNIEMDVTGKNFQVSMPNNEKFKSPLYFRKWLKNKNQMVARGGQGRNKVDLLLIKTNSCTDGITTIKYPFEVEATIGSDQKVKGCCRGITR